MKKIEFQQRLDYILTAIKWAPHKEFLELEITYLSYTASFNNTHNSRHFFFLFSLLSSSIWKKSEL